MEGEGEKEGPQRVALLHTRLGVERRIVEQQPRVPVVAPLGPRRQSWEVEANLTKQRRPIHSVESVGEVNLEEHLVGLPCVALHPLPGSAHSRLHSERRGYAHLQWPKVGARRFLDRSAEALGSQAAQGLANSNWPNVTGALWKRVQGGPGKVRHQLRWGLPADKDLHHSSEVGGDLVTVRGTQRLADVVAAQASWTCSTASAETTRGQQHLLHRDVRHTRR